MNSSYPVRYGRNYRVVLAIVLPALSIVPFIFIMRLFTFENELQEYIAIYLFLAVLAVCTLWLVKNIYPKAIVGVQGEQISIHFPEHNFLSPANFSFQISDITSHTIGSIGTDEYLLLELKNPPRKFQISPRSYSEEDTDAYNSVVVLLHVI